jgi:hypothetical protein
MRPLLPLCALTIALTGCHSPYIATTISNHTTQPITLIELDYPSASFGTQSLAPGQDFHYRFKILGSGPTTLLWTDTAHQDHKSSGPQFNEGEEGSLQITLAPNAAPAWNLHLLTP